MLLNLLNKTIVIIIGIFLFIGVYVYTAFADESTAQKLLSYLNLNAPGMEAVKQQCDAGNYTQAANLYKDIFVDHMADQMANQNVILGGTQANADDLINNKVTIGNLGTLALSTGNMGTSGQWDWFTISNDSYTEFASYVSEMGFPAALTDKFNTNGGIKYLNKWVEIWNDFAMNHYNQWLSVKTDPYYDDCWMQPLVCSRRNEAFFRQVGSAAKYNATLTKQALTGEALSNILVMLLDKNMPMVKPYGGAPNQDIYAGGSAMIAGECLINFYASNDLIDRGKQTVQRYAYNTGVMADGTDMEQSFGYEGSFLGFMQKMNMLYKGNIPYWMNDIYNRAVYRMRMFTSLYRPDNLLPNMAQGRDTWPYYLPKKDIIEDSLTDQYFSNASTIIMPFNSIYFPYGGFAALRNGWSPTSNYMFFKNSRAGNGHCDESANSLQLFAFGQNMLTTGGDMLYSSDATTKLYNQYMMGSASKNTVLVDSYSQARYGRTRQKTAYQQPIDSRFLTDDTFDFIEGTYADGYGIAGDNSSNSTLKISDVTHNRQVIYIKNSNLYVVTDRMNSTTSHQYTQTWNFKSTYANTEVVTDNNGKTIKTNKSNTPNLAIYNFVDQPINYTSYYGSTNPIAGWGYAEGMNSTYVPKVDVYGTWTGTGNQLAVSVLNPSATTVDAASIQAITGQQQSLNINGFEATLKDGSKATYLASKTGVDILTAYGVQTTGEGLLVNQNTDGTLSGIILGATDVKYNGITQNTSGQSSFEFIVTGGVFSIIKNINKPNGFAWNNTSNGAVPTNDAYNPVPMYNSLNDDFGTYPLSDGVLNYNGWSGGNFTSTRTSGIANENGNNYLNMSIKCGDAGQNATDSSASYIAKNFDVVKGKVQVDLRVRQNGDMSNIGKCQYMIGNSSYYFFNFIQLNPNLDMVSGTDWSDTSSQQVLQKYELGKWYYIRMVIDTVNKTYDLYVDGVKKITQRALRAKNSSNQAIDWSVGISRIRMNYVSDGKVRTADSSLCFDKVGVQQALPLGAYSNAVYNLSGLITANTYDLQFNNPIDLDTLQSIILRNNNLALTAGSDYSINLAEENTAILTISGKTGLPANGNYVIDLSGVKDIFGQNVIISQNALGSSINIYAPITVIYDWTTQTTTVQGQLNNGGEDCTVLVFKRGSSTSNPIYFDQLSADANGGFTFSFKMDSMMDLGSYNILIGGTNINAAQSIRYVYTGSIKPSSFTDNYMLNNIKLIDADGKEIALGTGLTNTKRVTCSLQAIKAGDVPDSNTVCFVLGLYDQNNKLVKIVDLQKTATNLTLNQPAAYALSIDCPANIDMTKCRLKLFMIDSYATMKPLYESLSLS